MANKNFSVHPYKDYISYKKGYRFKGRIPSKYGVVIFTNTTQRTFLFETRKALTNFLRRVRKKSDFKKYKLFWGN